MQRIEDHLRTGEEPAAWELVVRGRPLTAEGLLVAAGRTRAELTWRGRPFAAVSAEVTGTGRPIETILAGRRLRTRVTYAAAAVATVTGAGFAVLATFGAPHVSIVLPRYDDAHIRRLIEVLGPEQANPFYERRTR